VVKGDESPITFDSDEDLEAILRRELIEIAYFNGVSDPENLRTSYWTVCSRSDQHQRQGEGLAKANQSVIGSTPSDSFSAKDDQMRSARMRF
jgi:hypothetical protein